MKEKIREKLSTKVLIIGSGPAGYTAAIYAARACLEPIIVTGPVKGGQLTITADVENYPGFANPIQGPWLMEQMAKQAENVGGKTIEEQITSVDFSTQPFQCYSNKYVFSAQTIVISTGAEAKWLGLANESKYMGFGVSGCATCDGFFYKNKKVMVVGGGNTAVEEALYLTNHAKEVLLLHRRDELRAEKVLIKRLMNHDKIKPIWNSVLEDIKGDDNPKSVTGVKIRNVLTNEISEIDLNGVFIAIGHKPNTTIFKDYLAMDQDGYIITAPNSTKTNILGVFAAGDVQDKIYRQAVTAAGTGCMAALEAEKFISENS